MLRPEPILGHVRSQLSDGSLRVVGAWRLPVRILLSGLWFAIWAAWGELAILGFRKYVLHRPTFSMDQKMSLLSDYRVFWMVPLADVLVFLIPIAFLALLARRWSGPRTLFATTAVFATLTVLSLLFNFTWLHWGAAILLSAGAGIQLARFATPRADALHAVVRRSLPVMVLIIALAGLASTGWRELKQRRLLASVPAPPGSPNVLLIILDTVRGFSLSTYGYERETTPNLSRIASEGVRFERAFATAPWTLPSHASMFTGRAPHELSADMVSPLDGEWPTLAEAMSARGYATAGFVANLGYCTAESGLDRGFSHYEDLTTSWLLVAHSSSLIRVTATKALVSLLGGGERSRLYRKDADQINGDFLRWIPTSEGRPFFAFLNYYDAHRPYLPPSPYELKYSANIRDRFRVVASGSKSKLPPEAAQVLTDAYDGSLVYLDDRIGKLMAELEARGTLENTIVIVTADHGEQFGEHGLFFHANSLYTQLLQVPLIITGKGRVPRGLTIPTPVSLIDVPATILAMTDPEGNEDFPGETLGRLLSADSTASQRHQPLVAALGTKAQMIEYFAPKDGLRSIMIDGLHYIQGGRSRRGEVREELFDLVQDPREERDLAATDSGLAVLPRFRAALDSLVPMARRGTVGAGGR